MDVLAGVSIVVTGATSGIGRATCTALAARGALIGVHGRDAELVRRTVSDLGGSAAGFVADLVELAQVRRLADEIAEAFPALDVLVANAGIGFGADRSLRETSADGHELRFAVNYLAPFLLGECLLRRGLPRRALVNVASAGQLPLDFDDLESARAYDGVTAYRRSKLALVMATFDWAKRHPAIAVDALHPGTFLDTRMVVEAGITPHGPVERGVHSVVAAIERGVRNGGGSGRYFDETTPARAEAQAYDVDARATLRARSLELVGLRD